MIPNKKQRAGAQSVFVESVGWLATMLAVISTFLLTPKIYSWTIDWIVRYTSNNYGSGFEDFTAFIWGALLAATVFCLARATLSTSLMICGLALAARMF